MDNTVKILLLGGAAYLLYEWLQSSSVPAVAATGATGTTTPTGTTSTGTATSAPAAQPYSYYTNLSAQLNAAAVAGKGGWDPATVTANQLYAAGGGSPQAQPKMTVLGWGYYYTQVTGKTAPTAAQLGLPGVTYTNGLANYSSYILASDYINAMYSKGISGLGRNALGTLQMYRGVRDRLARAYTNQARGAAPLQPLRLPAVSRQRVIDKNYWDSQRSSRQLPYRWVN